MSTVNRRSWTFITLCRKHRVSFQHDMLSGAQLLIVDGQIYHRASMQYKLTGCLYWYIENRILCELFIQPVHGRSSFLTDAFGGELRYTLVVDGREIKPGDAPLVTGWQVDVSDPRDFEACAASTLVEFEHKSMEVLVDGRRVDVSSNFLDEELLALAAAEAASQAAINSSSSSSSKEEEKEVDGVRSPSAALFCGDPQMAPSSSGSATLGSQYSFVLAFKRSKAGSVGEELRPPRPDSGSAAAHVSGSGEGKECVLLVQPGLTPASPLRTTLIVDGKVLKPLSYPKVLGKPTGSERGEGQEEDDDPSLFPLMDADAAVVTALAAALASPSLSSSATPSSSTTSSAVADPSSGSLQPARKSGGFFSSLFRSGSGKSTGDAFAASATADPKATSLASEPAPILRFEVGKGFVRADPI